MERSGDAPDTFLSRHVCGDCGECGAEDWAANERAIRDGERVFSVYHLADGTKVWVISEADRASTCILLPDDY